MAIIAAAAEIKLRKIAAAAARGGGSMLRTTCWPLLLLAALAFMLVFARPIDLQLLAQRLTSVERLPHIRDSIFATQPFLFIVLNSMIFAVLAPSGLFNECCSPSPDDALPSSPPCSSRSSSSSSSTTPSSPRPPPLSNSGSSSSSTPFSPDDLESNNAGSNLTEEAQIPAPEPDPSPNTSATTEISSVSIDVSSTAPSISSSTSTVESSIQGKESPKKSPRTSNVSPPKLRVKRVRKFQKSLSPSSKTVVVAAEDHIDRGHRKGSSVDLTDSLEDEDFKHFIDNFIAHKRQQIFLQEREYEAATAAGSRA